MPFFDSLILSASNTRTLSLICNMCSDDEFNVTPGCNIFFTLINSLLLATSIYLSIL